MHFPWTYAHAMRGEKVGEIETYKTFQDKSMFKK